MQDEKVIRGTGVESPGAIPAATLASAAAVPLTPERPTRAELRRRTDRDIWALSWPVILSGALGSSVGLVDVGMLRSLGTEALVAVGWATQFYMLAQSVLMSGGVACVATMSRAIGAGRPDRAREALAASLLLASAVASLLFAVSFFAFGPSLRGVGVSQPVITLAVPYFRLTMGASLLFAVAFTYESAFRAAKNTRLPMALAAMVAATKVGLNYVLIYGALGVPALGLSGAGVATLLSQGLGLSLFVLASRRAAERAVVGLERGDFASAGPMLGETLRLALPAAAERLMMSLGLMSYFAVVTRYGESVIAAYTIGVRLLSFSWIPGMGFSTAASTLVGQFLGASDPAQAQRAALRAAGICVAVSIVAGGLYYFARLPLSHVLTEDTAVVAALEPLIVMLCLAQPFMALHFTIGGSLRGAGDTFSPLVAASVGTWGCRVALAYVLSHWFGADLMWLWAVLVLDHLARSIWLGVVFGRGAWRQNLGLSTRFARARS